MSVYYYYSTTEETEELCKVAQLAPVWHVNRAAGSLPSSGLKTLSKRTIAPFVGHPSGCISTAVEFELDDIDIFAPAVNLRHVLKVETARTTGKDFVERTDDDLKSSDDDMGILKPR